MNRVRTMIKILKNLTTYKWIVGAIFYLFLQSMAELFLPTLWRILLITVSSKHSIHMENWCANALRVCIECTASIAVSFYSSKAAMGLGRIRQGI